MPSLTLRNYRLRRARLILRALVLTMLSGGLLLFASVRVVRTVARLASSRTHPAAVLLVPGYRLYGTEVTSAHAARLERALALWSVDPDRVLLLSGAASDADSPSEAHAGLAHLVDLGLSPQATVLLEPLARDTEENLLRAAALLRDAQADGRITDAAPVTIVSNRWHLARCAWLAEQHGLPWRVCAAEARPPRGVAAWLMLLREGLSLLAQAGYHAGRIDPLALLRT
jgi:uncharacterized SAM-binding protein YcdF (DUF218 family)